MLRRPTSVDGQACLACREEFLCNARFAYEFGNTKSAHNHAKCEGPPPLAVVPMLGLTRSLAKANAESESYDFSLISLISLIFSGLWGLSPGDGNL